jgi:hypothetical protein
MPRQRIPSSDAAQLLAAMWMVSQCGGIHEAKEALQRLEDLKDTSQPRAGRRQGRRSPDRRKSRGR